MKSKIGEHITQKLL
jgi:light-regulated signal transduction histidine kinase (bacteriophytochrome)